MNIQVHTDNNIAGHQPLLDQVRETVDSILGRFGDRISRLDVHLSDVNGSRVTADDRRCVIEARVEGRQPFATTEEASGVLVAVNGAAEKLYRVLDSAFDKQRDEARRRTDPA